MARQYGVHRFQDKEREMEIDIRDYVDDEEIKQAILDGISGYSRDNAERVISNCGHRVATDVVNSSLGVTAEAEIAIKAREVISKLSSFTLFDSGGYGRPESEARKILNQSVLENRDAVSKAVKSAIHNLSKSEIVDIIKSGKVKMVIE